MADDDKDMFICRCEEVTLREIEQAIDEGFVTVTDITRVTRAGMGLCQGRTCTKTIARIIAQRTGKPLEEVLPKSYRYPVRPEKLQVVENEEFNDAKNS